MGASYGSPTAVTNGLVFCFDMDNPNSWLGEPVTNQFATPTPDASGNVTFAVQGNGTFKRVFSGTYGGYTIKPSDVVYRYDLGSTGCHYHGNSAAIASGKYVVYSCDYYISPEAGYFPTNSTFLVLENYVGSALSGGTDISSAEKGVWKTVQGYAGPTSGSGTQAMFLYPGGCSSTYLASSGYILMKNPMFEFRSDVKYNPFVNGTRPSSAVIKDIARTDSPVALMTATNIVYNTDGTFSFNGSSSYIDCGNAAAFRLSATVTMEAWVKPTTSSGLGNIVNKNQNAGYRMRIQNQNLWVHTNGNAAQTSDNSCPNNVWSHCVATLGPNGYSVFVNGVLKQNTATPWVPPNTTSGNAYIGCYGPGLEIFDGVIAMVKVYNRVLTNEEIVQNFNARRGKYGL